LSKRKYEDWNNDKQSWKTELKLVGYFMFFDGIILEIFTNDRSLGFGLVKREKKNDVDRERK